MKDYYGYLDALLFQYHQTTSKELLDDTSQIFGMSMTIQSWKMNDKEHNACIAKLKKDGFVSAEDKITFEGILFYNNGGYAQQEKAKIWATNKDTAYTLAVGIGTALAGLYAFAQIIKWLIEHCVLW